MGRIRCPTCQQFVEDSSADCYFCGHVFDARRRAHDEAEQLRRGAAVAASGRGGAAAMSGVATSPRRHDAGVLSAGALFSETLTVYGQNFIPFTIIGGIVMLPVAVLFAFALLGAAAAVDNDNAAAAMGMILVPTAFAVLAAQVASAAVTFGVVQHVRGRPASLGECISVGLSRMFPALGVAILVSLAVGLGYIACVIPGIILNVMYSVSLPVAVIERPGVLASMQRSANLTEGHRWTIFGILFCIGLVNWLLGRGTTLIDEALPGGYASAAIAIGIFWLQYTVSSGIQGTAASVVYYRLRVLKESVDVEEIAAVFD